jgi:copper chaperone
METTTFSVPSITCSVCSNKIQDGVRGEKGISDVSVDLKTKMVKVDYDPKEIQSKDIKRKVSSLGFEVEQ